MDDLLARFLTLIETSQARLAATGEDAAARPVKPGAWSRKQILGHLVDSASNNHQRFVRCALNGGLTGWPDYDQNRWVELQNYQDAPWAALVEFWAGYNRLLHHVLRHIPKEALAFRCHVEGSDKPLGEAAGSYLEHLEHHLRQILG